MLSEFAKENQALLIKAGLLDGRVIDAAGVKELAELPSQEILLAQLLQVMQSPISGLVNVLQVRCVTLLRTDAVRQKKEQEANA